MEKGGREGGKGNGMEGKEREGKGRGGKGREGDGREGGKGNGMEGKEREGNGRGGEGKKGVSSLRHSFQAGSGPIRSPIQWIPGALSLVIKRPRLNLTTELHPEPRLIMCRVLHPLSHTSSWRGTQEQTYFTLLGLICTRMCVF